ncbi:hypothetical protein Plec18167_002919 [Paecilomyces lecythidis]|uniref:MARVEL domain-containing protein n=1 Tax=Paecilomyces lecythidis TaxID=3004212 RepID=A0ABR3Y2J5_9EURO
MPRIPLQTTVTVCLTLINFVFTALIHCCTGVPPLLSFFFNFVLFMLWTTSLGLLGWSMSGTLTTTCDTANWGTTTGIMVCRVYKVLFTFTVTAFVAQVSAVVLDVIARRRQHDRDRYDPMVSDAALADVKVDKRSSSTSSINTNDPSTDAYNAFGTTRPQPQSQTQPQYKGRMQQPTYAASLEQYHAGEAQEYYETAPTRGVATQPSQYTAYYGNYNPYGGYKGYSQPPEQTRYDPGMYR